MSQEQKFFICKHCGNLVGMIHNAGVKIICCGEPMTELVPNTTDAAGEKHLPVVEVSGKQVTVSVGSVPHPMTEEHHIAWVYLQTAKGRPAQEPACRRQSRRSPSCSRTTSPSRHSPTATCTAFGRPWSDRSEPGGRPYGRPFCTGRFWFVGTA